LQNLYSIYAASVAIRALLFDFDGLIVDTETPSYASWQAVYREHGRDLPLDRWATIIGTTAGEFDPLDYLEELHGSIDREAVRTRRRERELELLEIEQLRPGILEYLEEAERRNLKTAIVSSSSRQWVDRHLARLERAEHFDEIVTADRDPERSKPRPTLYLEALDRLEVSADEAVAFEDSPNGVAAAKAAGVYTVAVPNRITESLGLGHADLVLPSLSELPLSLLLERIPGENG
jgi:HAD superfamily hydrolase (TIGR01509 family)